MPTSGCVRLDKPIGILLLLWPTLSALWLAAHGTPACVAGADLHHRHVLMRSAGCAVNDWADRRFDRARRAHRGPPARHRRDRAVGGARGGGVLAFLAFLLVLATNRDDGPAVGSGGRSSPFVYPFFKRFFVLPQAFLGIAFSFGIPMAYAAVLRRGAAVRVVAAGAQPVLGDRLRHRVRDGRSRRRPAARPARRRQSLSAGSTSRAVMLCYAVYLGGNGCWSACSG